jgi:tetratricopeptide (TPR) repeat protein
LQNLVLRVVRLATKKDKYLESAQKFIAKGQIDRAIKDYEQVVSLDPKDIRVRQRLAELLVRVNRKEDAVGEYDAIGRFYADNAYFLKAIAVYKQIQKLDPANVSITLTLASLNEKQGLAGNALAEYDQVYSYYLRAEQYSEALNVIDKMLAVDPENLNTQLKLAETQFAAGNHPKAYADFVRLLLVLRKREDTQAFEQIAARVRSLFPDKQDFVLDFAASLIEGGNGLAALGDLQGYLAQNKADVRAWLLLASAYQVAGQLDNCLDTYRRMRGLFPHELAIDEGLIRVYLESDGLGQALDLLRERRQAFVDAGRLQFLEQSYSSALAKNPTDVRVLEGLVDTYTASGDDQKRQVAVDKLASLGQDAGLAPETEPQGGVAAEGDIQEYLPPVAEELPDLEEEQQEQAAPEPETPEEWEEELDLSFLDEAEPLAPAAVGGVDASTEEPEPCAADSAAPDLSADMPFHDDLEGAPIDFSADEDVVDADSLVLDIDEDELEAVADQLMSGEELASAAPQTHPPSEPSGPEFASAIRLEEQVDEGDAETHYSLGIAYKEMGLYDEAIAELRKAAKSNLRRCDCLLLEGICHRDKGDANMAEKVFSAGCDMPGLSREERLNFSYELAYLREALGQTEDAVRLYQQIDATDPGFRDVVERMKSLHGGDGGAEGYDLDLVELEPDESE